MNTNNEIRLPSIANPFQRPYNNLPLLPHQSALPHPQPLPIITNAANDPSYQFFKTTHAPQSQEQKNWNATPHHVKKSKKNTVELNTFKSNFPIREIPSSELNRLHIQDLERIPNRSDIQMKKYSTSIDSRSFITVYEYQIDNNWIIWDYHTGLVHLTGLWKAIGNKKADIVKLIDSSPDLVDVVKRVRGGFLKIQGTWIPYEIAKKLARKFCYDIRFSLIPLFGYEFVNDCLKPNDLGFGMLRLDDGNAASLRSANAARRKREHQLQLQLQLQQQQKQQQQQQQQQQLPMTPYYYSTTTPQQLPTPTSSHSSQSSIFSFQQQNLLSPLDNYTMDYTNLPKLHTFTTTTNPKVTNGIITTSQNLQNLHHLQQQQQHHNHHSNHRHHHSYSHSHMPSTSSTGSFDADALSPKSSFSSMSSLSPTSTSTAMTPTSTTSSSHFNTTTTSKVKKNHKKAKSTSSINLNTVLEAAIKLDAPEYQEYDKTVIDAASSLMSVSQSWRNLHHNNEKPLSPSNEGKRKMDISGLLS